MLKEIINRIIELGLVVSYEEGVTPKGIFKKYSCVINEEENTSIVIEEGVKEEKEEPLVYVVTDNIATQLDIPMDDIITETVRLVAYMNDQIEKELEQKENKDIIKEKQQQIINNFIK